MKNLLLLLFCFLTFNIYAQSDGFTFTDDKIIYLKDSLLPKSIKVKKSLFCTKDHSYFVANIKRYQGKQSEVEKIVLKIDNKKIDNRITTQFTSTPVGWIKQDSNIVQVNGYGKFYNEKLIKESIWIFADNSQKGVYLQLTGAGALVATNLAGIKNNTILIGLNSLGLIISGIGFVQWLDSYRYLKIYNNYINAVDINDLDFSKYIEKGY